MTQGFTTLFFGLLILTLGAHFLVRGATRLALLLKVAPAVIGLTIIAMGTSLPELFVGVAAALNHQPDLIIGNLVGSNLLNMGLVVGLSSLILPIGFFKSSVQHEWPLMMGITVLAGFFLFNQTVTFWEGLVLLAATGTITWIFFNQERKAHPDEGSETINKLKNLLSEQGKVKFGINAAILLLVGFIGLHYGSRFFVDGATQLAVVWGMSERLIGITVVAIGTSLPELAVSLVATLKGRGDIGIGNIIGSNIFNIGGILGVCALINPINISRQILTYDFPWLIGMSILFFLVMFKSTQITRPRGLILLASYVIYTASLF